MMSQEIVEIVRRATDAFNRRDFDAWLAAFDPDIMWHAFPERHVTDSDADVVIDEVYVNKCRDGMALHS